MHKATITRDASGVPTGLSKVTSESLMSAAVGAITGIASQNEILIPENVVDSVVLAGVPAILGAVVQKKLSTGEFGIPFTA